MPSPTSPVSSRPTVDQPTPTPLLCPRCTHRYLDEFKLRELLKRYSEFIGFPIELFASKTTYETVPDPDAPPPEDEGAPPVTKSVPSTVEAYETMNLQKPIWVRAPRSVNESEYFEFYKSTFKVLQRRNHVITTHQAAAWKFHV